MVRVYMFMSVLVCAWFLYCGLNGAEMVDLNPTTAQRPTGPGQHFHK